MARTRRMMKGNTLRAARQYILASLLLLGSQSHFAQDFHPDRILISPKPGKAAQADTIHKQKGRKILKKIGRAKSLHVVRLRPGEDVMTAVEEYSDSGATEFAEPDYKLYASEIPNDPLFLNGSQWGLNSSLMIDPDIDAAEGWSIRHDAANVIVAIIDSGIRATHEDLTQNLWSNPGEIVGNGVDDDQNGYVDDIIGLDALRDDSFPDDEAGHGTHIAGIIGAAGNNGKGIAGVAWKVKLMPLKFLDATGDGFTADAVACFDYAIDKGASVINASYNSPIFSTSLQTAIQNARAAGIVVVCAAGNLGSNNDLTPSYPASFSLDNIVSVGAMNNTGLLESYSNFGLTSVDLAAPGTDILSCSSHSNTGYTNMSGTSMAAPIVTGVVALMRAQYPNASYSEILQRLYATVEPIPSLVGKTVTGGRVNLLKALSPYANAAFNVSVAAGTAPLSVNFTNTSIGDVNAVTWNFGDGSLPSTLENPSHVFAQEGAYIVTLTVAGTNGALATATKTINVVPTYNYQAVDYEWIGTNGLRRIFLSDNGVSSAEPLPFAFSFYGQPKSQIYIGANGLLAVDPANMGSISNADIPGAASPNGTILPYWDNLNPSAVGAVYVGTIGEAPNRKFVASWIGVTRNSSTDTMTFQAVLKENGEIQFNYQEVRPASTRGGGLRATVGVEDPSGLIATKYCYNGAPNGVTNLQSIVFRTRSIEPTKFKAASVANGLFQLELGSTPGLDYVIQASSNLVDWVEVKRGTVVGSGNVSFSEAAPVGGRRFYRAFVNQP